MSLYRSSPLRFLAPVALVAFGVAFLMVLSSYSSTSGSGKPSANEAAKQRDLGTTGKKSPKRTSTTAAGGLPTKVYVIRNGDTFGSIAEKTGVPIQKLQELNPEVDPQQLSTGQKIKLRE
jgi:LysM repeat protein